MKIFKYAITADMMKEDSQTFELYLPKFAWILSAHAQRNIPCIWALVDDTKDTEKRIFRLIGTGHETKTTCYDKFIGSCLIDNGLFVWHIFEITESTDERK